MDRTSPVRELMTTEVVTFAPEQTLESALRALVDSGVDAAPVVDADGHVVGMLSSADLVVKEAELHLPRFIAVLGGTFEIGKREFDDDLEKALGSRVEEIMTKHAVVVGPDDSVERAATLMHDKHVSRLPVVDDDAKLVGLVSRHDILRAILAAG